MDHFDTNDQESHFEPHASPSAARKESPYEDSPYEMPDQSQDYFYTPQPDRKPPKQKKERAPMSPILRRVTAAVLTVALVICGCTITAFSVNRSWEQRSAQTVQALTDRINDLEAQIGSTGAATAQQLPSGNATLNLSQLYAQNVTCVVSIKATAQTNSIFGVSESSVAGSGFIVSEDGYVITNAHVVADTHDVSIVLSDGTTYPAEVKGYDTTTDVAVLKADASGLPTATLGSSSEVAVGDMVAAIGNSLGTLGFTQTVGFVSGINREVTSSNTVLNMIQTDAAINAGNSGGPLFNMQGEVIGITTAKYSGTTGSGASIEGIGFAIPIDDVLPIVNDLMEHGYVTGAYLGVTVSNIDDETASMYDIQGAYVVSVVKGGSADRAGIQPKDTIVKLDSTDVRNVTDLTRALRNYHGGDTATVTLIRGHKEMTVEVTLDEKPDPQQTQTDMPAPDADMPSEGSLEEWYNWFYGKKGE